MTSNEIRPEQLLTILKHLATGKGIEVVASIIHLPTDVVREIAVAHGYPDREKLGYAVDEAQAQLDQARNTIPASTLPQGLPPGVTRPRPTAVQAPASAPPAQIPAAEKPDEISNLIDTAKNHDRARIQKLAEKILEDLAKLRGLIDAEHEAFQTRQRVAKEKAAAKAEIERLERELKAARDKLRPAKKSTSGAQSTASDGGPSAADIRAWATQKGLEVPGRGRLPQEIREAYDDAHQAAAS